MEGGYKCVKLSEFIEYASVVKLFGVTEMIPQVRNSFNSPSNGLHFFV